MIGITRSNRWHVLDGDRSRRSPQGPSASGVSALALRSRAQRSRGGSCFQKGLSKGEGRDGAGGGRRACLVDADGAARLLRDAFLFQQKRESMATPAARSLFLSPGVLSTALLPPWQPQASTRTHAPRRSFALLPPTAARSPDPSCRSILSVPCPVLTPVVGLARLLRFLRVDGRTHVASHRFPTPS